MLKVNPKDAFWSLEGMGLVEHGMQRDFQEKLVCTFVGSFCMEHVSRSQLSLFYCTNGGLKMTL